MPLNTRIKRKGRVLKGIYWNDHMCNIFLTIGLSEGDPELWNKDDSTPAADWFFEHEGVIYEKPMNFMTVPVYYLETKAPLWKEGKHIVQKDHRFLNAKPIGKAADNEWENIEVIIKKGDVLEMWRS